MEFEEYLLHCNVIDCEGFGDYGMLIYVYVYVYVDGSMSRPNLLQVPTFDLI